MRIGRPELRKRAASRGGEAVILFTIGENSFALPARAVAEILDIDSLRPIASELLPGRNPKVRHTLQRGATTYFVVDSNYFFRILPTRSSRVLLLRDFPVGLKVDATERMAEIPSLRPLPGAFRGEERHWYGGLALLNGQVIPVVNPSCFINRYELMTLQAALRGAAEDAQPARRLSV